ncbi:hypothetical protein JCM11251_007718 [Rhodosporidiobolus azoricus]
MAGLSSEQQQTYELLQGMGMDPIDARRAAQKYGSNIEAAANWCLNGAPPSPTFGPNNVDELDMPPLVWDQDVDLPHPSTVGKGDPPPYVPLKDPPPPPAASDKILPAEFYGNDKKNPSAIDLTGSDDGQPVMPKLITAPPSSPTPRLSNNVQNKDEDDDIQRALKASQADGDDELTKAMALSMATLGSTEEEQLSVVETIKPEDRVREDMSIPPILRSTSPLQTLLSAYLQALYSLPTWRNAILSYRTPDRAILSGDDFTDYWKGDGGSLGLPMALGDNEERENRLIALQRLFALMTLTRRSFLHITEVVRAFGVRESDFTYSGNAVVYKIKALHETLVEDFRICAGEDAAHLLAQGASAEEAAAFEKRANDRFTVQGRPVRVDEHLADELPPAGDNAESTSIIDLSLNPLTTPSPSLYTLLDALLISSDSRTTPPTQILHLMTNRSSTLVFNIEREIPAVTSLDSFGSGQAGRAKQEKKVFRPTPAGEGQDEQEGLVWTDRYVLENRVAVAKAREEIGKLEAEKEELEKRRKEVGETKDGREVRELVKGTVDFLRKSVEAEVDGEVQGAGEVGEAETERKERQLRLKEQWEKVGFELEGVLSSYDSSLSTLSSRISGLFTPSSSGETEYPMQRVGPYRLHAILMRNGLNGRGSSWAVVRGEDGRWWKIVDLLREETTLEQALTDPSGVTMDAGSTFFLYQKVDEDVEPVSVPPHLERIALLDNHSFASELPSSFASTISSWSLPPLSSLAEPETIAIPLVPPPSDEQETVEDVVLDTRSPEPVPEGLLTEKPLPPPVPEASEEKVNTPMAVDEAAAAEVEGEEQDALRLRGGATVEDIDDEEEDEGDEEEYDDDEIDEDEVELGLLQSMPEYWDVDYAVGKVGGLPKWLDPRSPLGFEDVTCGSCERAMSLLLQVNSPDDSHPHAAARSLYVFACRGRDCLAKHGVEKAVRVWRTQMPSPNEFYPHTEETTKLREECEEKLDPVTQLAGEVEEKKRMEPFPEWDIGAEPEPYEESYLPDPSQPAGEKEEGTEDAAEPDTRTGVDTAFLTFQERIEREPKQVLRFYRLPGIDDPQPLWASATKIRSEEVPTCELCRGERKIEFQILSTLLPALKDDYLEFDSLLVYTCLNHCEIPKRDGGKTGWAVECAFKQDFAAEGVKFGMGQLRRDLPQV